MGEKDLLLKRYKILEKVGQGGFGKVYKAYDTRIERIVALKEIPATPETSTTALKEAKMVANLNHPNIVTLHDFEEIKGYYYLIMEYIEGSTLDKILKVKSPLSIEESLAFAMQLCYALEYAHSNEVIHLDIKPENLILLPDGRVKVTDFGIARLKTQDLTTEKIAGTVAYMAPEQAAGKYIDEKADIFSAGLVIYEMVTGKNPFKAETPSATIFKILNIELLPPSKYNPEIPEELDQTLLKALEKEPSRRFENIVKFRYRLERSRRSKEPPEEILKPLAKIEIKKKEEVQESKVEPFFTQRAFEGIRRFLMGSFVFLTTLFFFRLIPFYPGNLSFIIPFLLFSFFFFNPFIGIVLTFSSLIPPLLDYSFPLGVIATALLILLIPLAKKDPLYSLAPFLAPFASFLKIDFFYPFFLGFYLPPLYAALLSSLGALFIEIYGILSQNPFISSLTKPNQYRLLPLIKEESVLNAISLIVKPFLKHPILIYQIFLWAIVTLFISLLRKKGDPLLSWLAFFGASLFFFLGYVLIPPHFKISSPVLSQLAPRLSFSFLLFLSLLLLKGKVRSEKEKRRKKSKDFASS